MNNVPPQRVSPIQSPDAYALPTRPDGATATALDAFRQTQFLLGGDLALFAEAMNLQLALVKDAYPSKHRTHALAAIIGLWARVYAYLGDAMLLASRASYGSTLPLLRAAVEAIAAEEALRVKDNDEHTKWLLNTLHPDEAFKAFEFELGRFFAGEIIAADPLLRGVYRPTSDLGRPNFGATLLQMAPESNNTRLALSFGDTSFHLGWAEIVIGWLLSLAERQLRLSIEADAVFPIAPERRDAFAGLQERIAAALGRDDRARIEEIEANNVRRYLVHGFRRTSGASPKKIVL